MLDAQSALFVPTRAAGLDRMAAFRPRMGRHYAGRRNHDEGPGDRRGVSQLSPWIRRRLVLETEAIAAAIAAHPPSAHEKFVQEVVWRTYFKGWLERRPAVWQSYRDGLERDLAGLDRATAKRVAAAEEGRTGLPYMDAWAEELVETGYLHNHARMWFASVWCFTLGLPWRIGADFFLRHLLDADPASNTLGWRWVAGLHTKGKAYAAQAWNIAKFSPYPASAKELNEAPEPLTEPGETPKPVGLRDLPAVDPSRPTGLLITEEDCHPESLGLEPPEAVATLWMPAARSPREVSPLVGAFDRGALADAAARLHAAPDRLEAPAPGALAAWARDRGVTQIVTAYVPVGPVADWLAEARKADGLRVVELRRDWDSMVWPACTAGFFKVKKEIPRYLETLDAQGRLL